MMSLAVIESKADYSADGGEQFDVARAHGSEHVQDEHQDKGEQAPAEAIETTTDAAGSDVQRESRDQRGEYECIRNTAIPHVVIDNQHGERN
jgi:hypothetical protein